MKNELDPEFSKALAPKKYAAHSDVDLPILPPHPTSQSDAERYRNERANEGFKRSLILHAIVILLFFVVPKIQTMFGLESESAARLRALEATRTAIRVDVVDLPRLKVTDLQNVDLSQEVNKELSKVQEEASAPEVSSTAMIDKTKKEETTVVSKESKKVDRVKELQDRLRADQKRRDAIAKLQGKGQDDKKGRPEMAGNIVSEGYAATGSVATAADAYNGKAKSHLQRNWRVPGWISAGSLKARIVVKIAPNGRVLFKQFSKKSGNAEFDDSVLKAVESADPFPATPEFLKMSYMEEGVEFGFPE
jgi:colicin import membrane protein